MYLKPTQRSKPHMSSSEPQTRPDTNVSNGHCIVSITTEEQLTGGIANALVVTYSTALAKKGYHHIIIPSIFCCNYSRP